MALPKGQGVLLPPFKAFLASNIPAVYDNTLSYYEELCTLIKYLETQVVPALNHNAEALTIVSNALEQLKQYVDNYFANLDVQEEINNKLDEMAEAGTLQEIITAYIQANVAWTFNTVSDMKAATNLVAGSYAQTLGFHTLNDGGGAIYKITNSGTANEMDVIAVGSLFANLVYGKEVNVKQLGAYGDGTTDDSAVFSRGQAIAQSESVVLYAPKAIYKLTSQINLKHIVFKCEGQLDNDVALILGANSNASTTTNVTIFRCNDIQIEGAKVSEFNIEHAGNVTFYADGNDSSNTSIAYCKYNGIEVASLTLDGDRGGWINENEFNIKRCIGNLTITGDGSYSHNNNRFNNICIEGSNKTIQIDYGHNNYILYRGEQRPNVVIGDSATTYANVIQYQYNSTAYNTFENDYTQDSTAIVQPDFVPTYKTVNLLTLNKYNAKNLDSSVYLNGDGAIVAAWSDLVSTDEMPADKPFGLVAHCDVNAIRIQFICYDADGNQIEGKCGGHGVSYNSTNHEYTMTTNGKDIYFNFYPSDEVKKIKFRFFCGNNVTFNNVKIDLIEPFLNNIYVPNKIRQDHRYATSNPGSDSATNHYWAAGDFVYCKNSSLGLLGWCCQYAGNPGTWKSVALDS